VKPTIDRVPVLVDEAVWPRFQVAVATLGETWQAPSGRVYALELAGSRLMVSLVAASYELPAGSEIDDDLFELACELQDLVGDPWSGQALRDMAALWETRGREAGDAGRPEAPA
jgi:hypothetical protein